MTKSGKILDLLEKTDLTNLEVARVVGCNPAYVRVVQARLLHGGATPSEKAWVAKNREALSARQRSRYQETHPRSGEFKSEIIRDLLEHTDLSNREIAEAANCGPAYVRTVQQRLLHGGITPADKAWRQKNSERVREISRDCMRRKAARQREAA